MKKVSLILGLGVLVLGGFLLFKNSKEEVAPSTMKVDTVKTQKRPSLKESRYIVSKAVVKKNSFPESCFSTLADLSALTMEEFAPIAQDEKSFQNFLGLACWKDLKTSEIFQALLKTSGCDLKQKNHGLCFTLLFMMKANFIAELNENKKPEDMSSEELAAHFVRMFFSLDKLNKENFVGNLKYVDELYSRYMNDPQVVEAYVGYMMFGQKITGEGSLSEKIDAILAESQGNSFKVDRLQIVRGLLNEDLGRTREVLDELYSKYSKEPDLHYDYAAYHWKNGNKSAALAALDRAISLGGNFQETRTKLSGAKIGDGQLFSISIGLNFENL